MILFSGGVAISLGAANPSEQVSVLLFLMGVFLVVAGCLSLIINLVHRSFDRDIPPLEI